MDLVVFARFFERFSSFCIEKGPEIDGKGGKMHRDLESELRLHAIVATGVTTRHCRRLGHIMFRATEVGEWPLKRACFHGHSLQVTLILVAKWLSLRTHSGFNGFIMDFN